MDDRTLERLAAQAGRRAATSINGEALAQRVVRDLRRPPATHWWQRSAVLRLAAVFAVLVVGGVTVGRLASNGAGAGSAIAVPYELEPLSAAELTEVLDSLEYDIPVTELLPVTLADLDETQLEELLASMGDE